MLRTSWTSSESQDRLQSISTTPFRSISQMLATVRLGVGTAKNWPLNSAAPHSHLTTAQKATFGQFSFTLSTAMSSALSASAWV